MNTLRKKKRVSRKGAKTPRKALFFAPLRALLGISFPVNDGESVILTRNIPARTDLCIKRAATMELDR
ncbi:MAG: hypothetical protein DM484_07090 [Candidatus Methylumidiphilus alinenensis]|uniref:Uncharacterized protein n=1 Tax=Candidatus Methylumidiphilus alinenensis TaxID=2202197 RepID=A0A2W4RFV5_9GAMM|nr:MAG: hypothetical protein DM484_07090 [Candidatus Methylumidiphilus alinenensis]